MNSEKSRAEQTLEAIKKMSLAEVQAKLQKLRDTIKDVQNLLKHLHEEREEKKKLVEDIKTDKNSSTQIRANRIILYTNRIEHLTRLLGTNLQMIKGLRTMENIYARREEQLLKQEANNPKETLLKKNNNNNNSNTQSKSLCQKLGNCFGRWTKKNKKSGGRRNQRNSQSRRKNRN
jgi:hypothetical protein